MIQLGNTHEKPKYSISKESNKFTKQLDFTITEIEIKDQIIEAAKEKSTRRKLRKMGKKPIYGQYEQRIENADGDIVKSNPWLKGIGDG